MANARKIALQALLRVEGDGAYSNLVLSALLKESDLSHRDVAFCEALTYGVLERKITLDFIINQYAKVKTHKMNATVRNALRLGVYQLVYMDKVPPSAAVNESVKLIKNSKFRAHAGFVNGILRSVLRGGEQPGDLSPLPLARQFSVAYSMPEELVAHYIKHYGQEHALGILQSFLGRVPVYVRVNSLQTTAADLAECLTREGWQVQESVLPNVLQVVRMGDVAASDAYRKGLFHVQDLASAYAIQALQVQPGMRVLELCAAPGGKSFTLVQQMENKGELISCDLYPQKVALIQKGAVRLGLSCLTARVNDATVFDPSLGLFDRVLCDLPCSGLGVLGRKPEIRYKQDFGLQELPDLQQKMLQTAYEYLKPGGVLVFSTCTLNPAENQQNIAELLRTHADIKPLPVLPDLPRVCGEGPHEITLLPHVHHTDGFFVSAVQKEKTP